MTDSVPRRVPSFAVALGTLSIVRVPITGDVTPANLAASTAYYPLIGAMVGAVVSCILWMPVAMPDEVRAALALAVWIGLSGAFHLDGWADCCDAAFAPLRGHDAPFERRLAILKDPHIGTFGVTGIVLLCLVKWTLLMHTIWWAPIIAAAAARYAIVIVLQHFPAARPNGLVAAFGKKAAIGAATCVTLIVVGAFAWMLHDAARIAAASLGSVIAALLLARWLAKRFGGITGDVCGASAEFAEALALGIVVLWP